MTSNMREYISLGLKGIAGGAIATVNGSALIGHPIPPVMGFIWIPSFGGWTDVFQFLSTFGGCAVVVLTGVSLLLKIRKQWEDKDSSNNEEEK